MKTTATFGNRVAVSFAGKLTNKECIVVHMGIHMGKNGETISEKFLPSVNDVGRA